MNIQKNQLDALMQLCTAPDERQRQAAKAQIQEMLIQCRQQDFESTVRGILLDIGAPDHLTGHAYMVEALRLCLEDRMYINNITFGLYPQIAAKFGTTASRVERALRNLIEVACDRADQEVLARYFGNTISAKKGKPTNAEFIARIFNEANQKLHLCA